MPQVCLDGYGSNDGRVSDGLKGPIVDPRQEAGRRLAHDQRIKNLRENLWTVPARSGGSGYVVDSQAATCSCDDYELRAQKCKHLWAVQFKQAGTEETLPPRLQRPTYPQNWPTYHFVACREKTIVQQLLRGLCDGIISPPHPGRGPKPVPLGDVVFGMVMRTYLGTSARNACPDIQMAAGVGHISRAPRANTLVDYYNKPELIPLLKVLIEESASPLKYVEKQFAVDSTGFSTSVYRRWYDAKYGRERSEQGWLKAHAMVGTKTHTVTAVSITASNANDCPELPGLLAATERRFTLKEVSADKAYLSHDNLAAVEAVGALPYIPFKSNNQGEGPAAWQRLWAQVVLNHDEFLKHYHRRSNVESAFSGMKRKFGASVRSRNFVAQTNEVLCLLICWNLSCLAHAMHELNLKPVFDLVEVPEEAAA